MQSDHGTPRNQNKLKIQSYRARSIQPKFQLVRPGKEDHLKRWTSFFETFLVGPNRSIEFWTEISRNFGWMNRGHHDAFRSEFWSPDFFRLQLTQFLKMAFITAMIIAFLISNPRFSIWNISYISLFYSSWMCIQIDINECTRECRQTKQTTLRSHTCQFIPTWA